MQTRPAPRKPRSRVLRAISTATLLTFIGSAALAQTLAQMPKEQLLQLAQEKRDAKQWSEALHYYQQGRSQYPKDADFQYGEVYILADSGQQDKASALADDILNREPNSADALLVKAYTELRKNGNFAALEYVDRAIELAPKKTYVVREYIYALQRSGMSNQALEVARKNPSLLTPAQNRSLEADAVADIVRLSDVTSRSESERFMIADRALERYEILFNEWRKQGPEADEIIQRARIDRLQALHSRFYMSELVREYEALQAEGAAIPPFALGDIASAYLYLRQPEKAQILYEQLIASNYQRDDDETRQNQDFGLLYSLSDRGNVGAAQALSQPMPEEFSKWRYIEGEKVNVPNAPHLDALHTTAMMDFYANDTVGSQSRLESFLSTAPANNSLRTDLAWIYRSRGWPRKAEAELKVAETYEPREIATEVGQGQTALDLQEWRQAEALAHDVSLRFPEDARAKRLNRLWEVHNLAELQISGYKGLSNNNPVTGNRDFGLEATVYTSPLNYNWRLFAGTGHRASRFEDGKSKHNFGRMGVEWRSRDWNAEAEISSNHFGYGSTPGARIAVTHDLNDYWSLSAAANWRSRATPLQALHSNITSNSMELGVRWRESERREWGVGLTPSRFSDGNHRTELFLDGKERLLTRPTWFLDLGLEGYAVRNSRTDVPYYSPRRELGLTPFLTWNHTIYQRYETQWTQQASIGFGGINQQGFGTGSSQLISYGQRYKHNDVLEMGATLSGTRRPYDGVHEREWRLVFDLIYRF